MNTSFRAFRCFRSKVFQEPNSAWTPKGTTAILLGDHGSIVVRRLVSTVAVSRSNDAACPRCQMQLAKSTVIPYRTFIRLPKLPNPLQQIASKKIDYSEKQIVGYSMDQMFEVVSGVESYQEFVPWCTRSTVHSRSPTKISADMVIGFPPVTESYTSVVTMRHPHFIEAECRDGKLFHFMVTTWRFSPGLPNNAQTSTLELSVSFEFVSALHSRLARVFFDEVVRKSANAFLKRAELCYGKGSIKSRPVVQYS